MTVTFDCVHNYQKEMDFVSRLERDALKKGFVLEFEPTVETVSHDRCLVSILSLGQWLGFVAGGVLPPVIFIILKECCYYGG